MEKAYSRTPSGFSRMAAQTGSGLVGVGVRAPGGRGNPPAKIAAALQATEKWIAQPNEENRRAAMESARDGRVQHGRRLRARSPPS